MRTIQMTLDDNLVKAVDRVSKKLHTSRSAFTRKALKEALAGYPLKAGQPLKSSFSGVLKFGACEQFIHIKSLENIPD